MTEAVVMVDIRKLHADPALRCRAVVDPHVAPDYARGLDGLPPAVVFGDARAGYWLADGFYRLDAARESGRRYLACVAWPGGRPEALLYAASANITNGVRRTQQDARLAVRLVLDAKPAWPDREVGRVCCVDHKTVAAIRLEVLTERSASGESPQMEPAVRTVRRGGTEYEMDTAAIGRPAREQLAALPEEALDPRDVTALEARGRRLVAALVEVAGQLGEAPHALWCRLYGTGDG